MKDRTIKSKSPWMKYFTVGTVKPVDDLDKANYETFAQVRDYYKQGKGIKRRTLK